MLHQQKIDEAFDAANAALAQQPNAAALLAAKGDFQFRRGEMSDAEVCYLTAKKLDPKEVHAYLGLARLYASYSVYRKAYDLLQSAHEVAPDDIEVQRAWLRMLPRKERLTALEAYLAGPHPDDEEETKWMTEYLGFLKSLSRRARSCVQAGQQSGADRNQAGDHVRGGWTSDAGHRPVGPAQRPECPSPA